MCVEMHDLASVSTIVRSVSNSVRPAQCATLRFGCRLDTTCWREDLAQRPEHAPGEAAPAAGTYEQLNIFGRPTGIRVNVVHGHPLPPAPLGHNWTLAEENAAEC
jgi:hypothetical protein